MAMAEISSWAPNHGVLSDIIELLKQADSPNSEVQRRLAEAIGKLASLVDAPCYYCFILITCINESLDVRQRAGLLLKARISNLTRQTGKLQRRQQVPNQSLTEIANEERSPSEEELKVLQFVKVNVLRGIVDPNREIRKTIGSVLSTLVAYEGVERFPNLLPALFELLDNPNTEIAESSLSSFGKIVEDEMAYGAFMDVTTSDSIPALPLFCANHFIPKLISTVNSDAKGISMKRLSLICLNHFQLGGLFAEGDLYERFFNSYWDALGNLALDRDPELRQLVLSGMTSVTFISPKIVLTNLPSLLPFILQCLNVQETYEVRLEVLEFLTEILKCNSSHAAIQPHLSQLTSLLIQNTPYSASDYAQMDASQFVDGNSQAPDAAEDIAPAFRRKGYEGEEGEDDEEGDESGETSSSLWGPRWTVRKIAAMLIDVLAVVFAQEILPFVLPDVEKRLQHEQWEVKESAVLTLGAVARGCIQGLDRYLPGVLVMLIPLCDDPKPILRSISLWTLSRFSIWICPQPKVLELTCQTLLSHVMDSNKKVQEAACSAFASLEEVAGEALLPFLPLILQTFSKALRSFQTKNLMVLLDATVTLADTLGPSIDIPEFYTLIFGPLLERWSVLDGGNPTMIATFECVSCVLRTLKQGLPPYIDGIIQRSLFFIRDTLHQLEACTELNAPNAPNKELIECSFDVLSSLCEAQNGALEEFLKNTDCMLLLQKCCEMSSLILGSSAKQGCFALIGDLTEAMPHLVAPHIPVIVPLLLPYMVDGSPVVCHNASWALGQIALHAAHQGELGPFADKACEQLVRIMVQPSSSASLIRNSCITLGRIALVCPDAVTVEMEAVFGLWCRSMTYSPNDKEKTVAFNGLCNVLNQKQTLAVQHMPALLDAICSLYLTVGPNCNPTNQVPAETHEVLKRLIHWLHTSHPGEWKECMIQIKPSTPPILASIFGVTI